MRNKSLKTTILFIVYLILVFSIFLNIDRRLVGVLAAIGVSIFTINLKMNIEY